LLTFEAHSFSLIILNYRSIQNTVIMYLNKKNLGLVAIAM